MTLEQHRPLTAEERQAARERIRIVRALLDAQFAALEARLG
jgi:Trp operon repressor